MNDELENMERPNGDERGKRWMHRIAIGGATVAVVAGISVAAATTSGFGFSQERGGMMHSMGGMGMTFAERRFERVLEHIEATPEQSDRLRDIYEAARDDLIPIADGFKGLRDDLADILGAAEIDREAAEKLRAERVAAVDQASRRITTAMLDAAEVLTPEQRAEMIERFKERRAHHRW